MSTEMFLSCGLSDTLLDRMPAVLGVWGGVGFPLVLSHRAASSLSTLLEQTRVS